MKKLKPLLLSLVVAAFAGLVVAGPPTCSTCVTQQGIGTLWQGTVMEEWYDNGVHHTEYLQNPGAVMCLHNGCLLTAMANQCDSTTSNKVVKVLFTCPPSTNAVVSYLWMPPCAHTASWNVNWICAGCELQITPAALYMCSDCNTNQ